MTDNFSAGKFLQAVLFFAVAAQAVWLVSFQGRPERADGISLHMMPRRIAGAAAELEPDAWITGCARKYLDRREYYEVTLIPRRSSGRVQLFFTGKGNLIARDELTSRRPDELPFTPLCPAFDIVTVWEHACLGRQVYSVTDISTGEAVENWYFPDGEPIPAADGPLSAVSSIRLNDTGEK